MSSKKTIHPTHEAKSTVEQAPLTEPEFESFLRKVSRFVPKKPRPEKEKPQTINTWAGLLSRKAQVYRSVLIL